MAELEGSVRRPECCRPAHDRSLERYLSDRVLPGVVNVADQVRLETFRPKNNRVNLAAVAEALPVLATADQTLAEADARVMAIDVDRLLPVVRARAGDAQAKVHKTAAAVAAAHDAARLLPTMWPRRARRAGT